MPPKIYALCLAAHRNSHLDEQLRNAENPDRFVEIAAEYGYDITVEELGAALTEFKTNSRNVSINNDTGDTFCAAQMGRAKVGIWLMNSERLGLVRPFCNLEQLSTFNVGDMLKDRNNPFLEDQCFLPQGYFTRVYFQ